MLLRGGTECTQSAGTDNRFQSADQPEYWSEHIEYDTVAEEADWSNLECTTEGVTRFAKTSVDSPLGTPHSKI